MEADFAHVWTGREAVGKLTGSGLTDALRTEVSGDTATLDGKKYFLSRMEVEEFLVTFATQENL
jgi:phosphopantetheinyl transferase